MCLCSGIGLLGGVAGGSYVHGLAVGAGHAVGLGCAGRDDVYIMKAGQSVQTSIIGFNFSYNDRRQQCSQ